MAYILGHFELVGLAYQPLSPRIWASLTPGTTLLVVRERFNPHDPLAVSLHTAAGERIGYLRREENRIPSALLDQDAPLDARLVEITFESDQEPASIRVEISLTPTPRN